MRPRRFSALAVTVLITLAAACGGKSSGPPMPTTARSGASASASAPVAMVGTHVSSGSTAPSSAQSGQTFTSTSKGYSITYPEDWTVHENGVSLLGYKADLFLAPAASGFTTNVNILCDSQGAGMAANDFLQENLKGLKSLNVDAMSANDIQSGTGIGKVITYTATSLNQDLDFAQVYLADAKCGWVLTLSTKAGDRDKYMDVFLNMAKTFTPH